MGGVTPALSVSTKGTAGVLLAELCLRCNLAEELTQQSVEMKEEGKGRTG